MDVFKQWLAGFAAFIALDLVWIGLVANGFYRRALGPLLRMDGDRMDPRIFPAAALYALVVAGLMLFALPRGRGTLVGAVAWSSLFGIIGYSVYDLTNYATLQGFPLRLVAVDMIWGGVVCGLTGAVLWTVRPG